MDSAEELALVRRAREGDSSAFAALAEHHGPRLLRFLVTMTGNPTVAEDLRQDALQRALEKLDRLEDPGKFGSWLLSIACNRCRSQLRSEVQRNHRGEEALAEVVEDRRSALSSIVRREDATHLALAIDRLPILLREAFVLFAVEGMPYAEIAVCTEVAEGTLMVRVHRAKALLRQQLGEIVDTWWVR